VHDLARQGTPDDLLGQARCPDEPVQVDARLDAQLVAQLHHVLGADIARGLHIGVIAERAAAQAADGAVEQIHPFLQGGIEIGRAHAARVVQVQAHPHPRRPFAHGVDAALDLLGVAPAHGVAQENAGQGARLLRAQVPDEIHDVQHRLQRDLALHLAAEGGRHIDRLQRQIQAVVDRQPLQLPLLLVLGGTAIVGP